MRLREREGREGRERWRESGAKKVREKKERERARERKKEKEESAATTPMHMPHGYVVTYTQEI